MTKSEFSRAVAIAQSGRDLNIADWMHSGMEIFDGFGLPGFTPVPCTLEELAKLISYQSMQLNGEFDQDALAEVWRNRRRFMVFGRGSDVCVADANQEEAATNLLNSMISR